MQVTSRYLWHTLLLWDRLKNKHGKILEHKLFDKDTILWQNIVKKYLPEYSSELHISDNNTDYPHENPNHDPLHKVRPFIQMCERAFQLVYRPGCDLSFDEACCPFKGRVWFCVYNSNKPAKFHMKLFQICEGKSGYICAFHIYTKKNQTRCTQNAQVLDPSCTTTSNLVAGLMDSVHLLDKGHRMYMDNFYASPKLYDELFFHIRFLILFEILISEGTLLQNNFYFLSNDKLLLPTGQLHQVLWKMFSPLILPLKILFFIIEFDVK